MYGKQNGLNIKIKLDKETGGIIVKSITNNADMESIYNMSKYVRQTTINEILKCIRYDVSDMIFNNINFDSIELDINVALKYKE